MGTQPHLFSGHTATPNQWAHSHIYSVGTQPHLLSGHTATLFLVGKKPRLFNGHTASPI